ncbi:hypothetical protein [Streptomyces griseosporeus]|uniref:hypothetical protein n=1 Tax=Streptomyces griseosporeus TaxID=1910 RepID=UPI0036F55F53
MTSPGRYHLLLTVDGWPAQHGWWDSEPVARDKVKQWIGAWGRPGARITLTDEETGCTLTTWPDER